jgi:hypothetical protein
MRRPLLYVIPIVHNEADLGSLAEATRRNSAGADARAWGLKQVAIAQFWKQVRTWCSRLPANLSSFRLYQDGLPVCGTERAIVEELAAKGSENHRLLLELLERGATLEGTESGPLLVEEYNLAVAMLNPANAPVSAAGVAVATRPRSEQILHDRDRFIADRIAATLKPGETGLLFLGYLHDVTSRLPAALDVQKVSRLG